MKNVHILLFFALWAVLASCSRDSKKEKSQQDMGGDAIVKSDPEGDKFSQGDTVKAVAQEVVLAFEKKDYNELIKYFSDKGVVFSPYATLSPKKQMRFTADEFLAAVKSNKEFKWGQYDGTGEEIKLSVAAYLKKFVTKANFSEAEAISFDAVMKRGNSINNIFDVYPNAHYVEFHFSGLDPKYEGMDWTSLRLVFERIGEEYYLIAVVQDQWTV